MERLPPCEIKSTFPDVFRQVVDGIEQYVRSTASTQGYVEWKSFVEMISSGNKKRGDAISQVTEWENANKDSPAYTTYQEQGYNTFISQWNARNPTLQMERPTTTSFRLTWNYGTQDISCNSNLKK